MRRSVSRNLGSVWKAKNRDFVCYYDARLDTDDRIAILFVVGGLGSESCARYTSCRDEDVQDSYWRFKFRVTYD